MDQTTSDQLRLVSTSFAPEALETSISEHADAIKKINDKIFNNPELSWCEDQAHDVICDYFQSLGPDYTIHRHAYGLKTSFLIEASTSQSPKSPTSHISPPPSDQRTVIFNAEYDALPITSSLPNTNRPGSKALHACGHNLIASASIASFIACWETLKSAGGAGAVRLLGTPAEERGGGKIKLLEAGAYTNASACLMAHPGPLTSDGSLRALAFTRSLASQRIIVDFRGLASHAAFAQDHGKNALDALVISYVTISALRRQLKPLSRVAGIIKNGGTAANVIPDRTRAEYSIRAATITDLVELRGKVMQCLESGGSEAGCTTHIIHKRATYWDLISNEALCHDFTRRMNEFNIKTAYRLPEITDNPAAATDQGNVSHVCPAMQAAFFIDSAGSVNHQPEFAAAAGTEEAFKRALDCAKGLAAVGFDVLTNPEVLRAVKTSHESAKIRQEGANENLEDANGSSVQEQIAALLESPSRLLSLDALSGITKKTKEQVVAALMAADRSPQCDTNQI